jgi:hypothetical protein
MRTKHHAHLTLFCLTDTDCAEIPDQLNFTKILENVITVPPDITTPEDFTTPDYNFTGRIPVWPVRFVQADYTHTMMWLYAGFNAGWAVTCFIVISKWKERAVEDSCLTIKKQNFREVFQRPFLPSLYVILRFEHDRSN